jgi:hypothetical protein
MAFFKTSSYVVEAPSGSIACLPLRLSELCGVGVTDEDWKGAVRGVEGESALTVATGDVMGGVETPSVATVRSGVDGFPGECGEGTTAQSGNKSEKTCPCSGPTTGGEGESVVK